MTARDYCQNLVDYSVFLGEVHAFTGPDYYYGRNLLGINLRVTATGYISIRVPRHILRRTTRVLTR